MAHPKNRRLLLACSLLICVPAFSYAVQEAPLQIKGVTIESRIYQETKDGEIREIGTLTTYISESGNWKRIKRNSKNKITLVLIADSDRAGVFLISKDTAAKMGDFTRRTAATTPEEYRTNSQYVGETTYHGYKAFIGHTKDGGKLLLEHISILEFRLPVKTIDYEEDGSKTITEAVSITPGEPASENVTLPPNVIVTSDHSGETLKLNSAVPPF